MILKKYKFFPYILLLIFYIFSFPVSAEAITFYTNSYSIGQQSIDIASGDGGPFHIFSLSNSNTSVFSQGSYVANDRFYLNLPGGEYSVVETLDADCSTYTECTAPEKFVNEFLFTVMAGFTLNKTIYSEGESIVIASDGPSGGNPFQVYDFSSNNFLWGNSSYTAGDRIDLGLISGNYSVVETNDYNCFYVSYDECKSSPAFLKEVMFTVVPASSGTGDVPLNMIRRSEPHIEISSPLAGVLKDKIPIIYHAYDYDGDLADRPVSVFYTDKLNNINQAIVPDEYKTLIVKNLEAAGTYIWNGTNLSESKFYKIIVSAVDKLGMIGQAFSDLFTVDLTPPTFVVKVDPPVVKNSTVKISIESSEELLSSPKVFVRQFGSNPVPIKISGGVNNFSGSYNVVSGYDGTAKIEIVGVDKAGNEGGVIVGGGTFSVGINPPAKPVVLYPLNNEKVTSENLSIRGTGRDDTEIIVTVNGVNIYKSIPNPNGEFFVNNVKLKKNIRNGKNTLNIIAKDNFGAYSEAVVHDVFFNIAPTISIKKPEKNDILSGLTILSTQTADDNGDPIHFLYEIAPISKSPILDKDWQKIAEDPSDTIYFDTTKFSDGYYTIRAIADDGTSTVISAETNIRIRNEESFFIRFYGGLRTTVNQDSATVRGVVYAQKNIFPQPTIKKIEYSLNAGKSWVAVPALDGNYNSPEEHFEVLLKNLKEGDNDFVWRTTDSRGIKVQSEKPIIVDRVKPLKPKILFPENGVIINNENNETKEKGKFIFTLRGKAEPGTMVNVEVGDKKYVGRTSFDGTFRINDIKLAKIGKYSVKAFVVDEGLNISPTLENTFVYNNLPNVIFINPSQGRGVSGNTTISWLSKDFDNDHISNDSLAYRRLGQPFVELAKNLKDNKFAWDTTKLKEGNDYELRLIVSDSLSTVTTSNYFSIDRNIPSISILNIKNNNLNDTDIFEATGEAGDIGSGIAFLEYQFRPIDSTLSKNQAWYKASINKGVSKNKVSFSIKNPITFPDGNYQIVVRAVDFASNVSLEINRNIRIDNTPPRVGSFQILAGNKNLLPENGNWNLHTGVNNIISISLEEDTIEAHLFVNNQDIPLVKDLATGLWKGSLLFAKEGTNDLFVSATDASGNLLKNYFIVTLHTQKDISPEPTKKTHWWSWIFNMI